MTEPLGLGMEEPTALFVFFGASPHTDWLRGEVAMDEDCLAADRPRRAG